MLEPGKKAPAFKLPADDGSSVSLAELAGKNVVVYFYPRDNTPGCTLEAQDFRDHAGDFKKRNTVVLGVSKDSIASHCKFRDRFELNFRLLADETGATIEKYGAWGEKSMYGKKSMGIIRSTVIVGPDGKVKRVFPKVKVAGHVEEVLQALDD